MHLLSRNGPIDVLVCPEPDESTAPTITTHADQQNQQSCGNTSRDLDVSLSSMASREENVHNGLMDTFPDILAQPLTGPGVATGTSADGFLPSDMFECLSPPCNDDEFYPTLSPSEGILELFDLA